MTNFEFAYPGVLALLALIPFLAAWLLAPQMRRKRTPTFLFSAAHRLTGGSCGLRVHLRPFFDLCFVVALALLVIAMARPQVVEYEETQAEGIDIYVAFDMSGSMRAIDHDESDVYAMERRGEVPKNRFEEAQQTLLNFVASRPNDRIGTVLFAKDAFLQFPLTLDHGLILEAIDELEMGDIDPAGTAIGNAVGRALAGLTYSEADTRIIILITDGDRRGGNISPMQAADMAADMGVKIYPVLVGRDGEALIAAGRDPFRGRTNYRRVEFPIDPDLMQHMADRTGGRYFRALDAISMEDDLHAILDEYDRTQVADLGRAHHEERFPPFLIAALLLLGLHFLGRHTLCRTFP